MDLTDCFSMNPRNWTLYYDNLRSKFNIKLQVFLYTVYIVVASSLYMIRNGLLAKVLVVTVFSEENIVMSYMFVLCYIWK